MKENVKQSSLLLLVFLFFNLSVECVMANNNEIIDDLSLVRLIAVPENYSNHRVRIVGFASFQFENTAIYISQLDYTNNVTKNAIWLNAKEIDRYKMLDQKYVVVEGIFDSESYGHLKLFSGTIQKIERISQWID